MEYAKCNGTRLMICHLHNNCIDAKIITGVAVNTRVIIPRIRLSPSDSDMPFVLKRCQFPIRLAYSMTINKAQGQTFRKVEIYMERPCFSHGQLYVAFSRARRFDDIYVQIEQTTQQGSNRGVTYTDNIVYNQVLC